MTTTQRTLPAKTVLGLTGGFGSGCTTAAKHLRDERGANHISLSAAIKKRWEEKNPGKPASREDLQRLGDQMREEGGAAALVKAALEGIEDGPLVIDGIRNLGEVDELRDRYGYDFTLVSIMTTVEDRWDRIGSNYTDVGKTKVNFIADDTRDRNEETKHGQQVELCVDASDVLIDNGRAVNIGSFKAKVIQYADLVAGLEHRYPTQEEIFMNMAYGSSHSSKCVKRHVGAVVIDRYQQQVVSVGYNENPNPTKPCVEEPEYDFTCYRDIVRNNHFRKLQAAGARCPSCGSPFTLGDGPPWKCNVCASQTPPIKTNLESSFFPDRAMNWCTAIHAEVWALTQAGERARGGCLYTTTFPCFQCTEQIIHAGIKRVCYTEAYSDAAGEIRFELAGITCTQFEGVRSASFHRIFKSNAPA